jgi:drug/metabolite transporter (DMT)-like permease
LSGATLVGELACLAAALCWAWAVTLFRRPIAELGAWAVSLAKNSGTALLLGLTVLLLGQGEALIAAPWRAVGLVALSGLLGMTLGDTALFAAVHRLGVHRSLLLQTLAPIVTVTLAMGFYGERLGPWQLAGGGLILLGVALVVAPPGVPPSGWLAAAQVDAKGILYAVAAAVGQGTGVVLAKAGMEELPVLGASFLRILAATVGLLCVLGVAGRLPAVLGRLGTGPALRSLVGPTFVGTYISVLLLMAGIAYAPASVASVLIATTPVWSLFLDARTTGVPITLRALGGTFLSVAGVAVLVFAAA